MGILGKKTQVLSTERNELRFLHGQQGHYVADCTSANVTVADDYLNCRYVECDVAGIIKVDYKADNGVTYTEVKALNAGERWCVPNVTRVYRYYVGTTACTAQSYTDAGVLVTGVKLRF